MEQFRVTIKENELGEISIEMVDFVTKQKSNYSYKELKELPKNTGSLLWMADFMIKKVKPIFRNEEVINDDPF